MDHRTSRTRALVQQGLETACKGAIDFHMADDQHAAFALNNVVYWLRKQ